MRATQKKRKPTLNRKITKKKAFNVTCILAAIVMLTACAAVGPDYLPPTTAAPEAWHTELQDGLKPDLVDPEALAEWWTTLDDPILSELITRAVQGSLDLKQAMARVREARARRGISRANIFPTLDTTGSFTRSRSSENLGSGGNTNLNEAGFDDSSGDTTNLYKAGFDAGWELDIFGGVRRAVEAAEADLEASRADLRDVLISLAAEAALNYVEARTFQTRLAVAEANLEAQQETFELIRSRYQAGLDNELSLQQARYNLEDTRSRIPSLRSGLEASLNRLAVLMGQAPGAVHDRLAKRRPIPVTPPTVAVGVPAETLRRRPDIRKAERELAAQTARIGEATADLYPKFQLFSSIGLESINSEDFFQSASRLWSFGPSFSWPIFDAGAIRQNIKVQSALQEQFLFAYEAAVLDALEEVENALTAYAEEQLRRERLLEAVDAAQRAVDLAQDQYTAGLVDFSNVLDAQRSLLSFEDELAQSDGSVTSNLISLYKGLGGGWQSMMH